jgi:demethylmenaquinone methyltransferase/2-methoxy-6-polyprenyl-1,4-benzoquinol methylase/phosphoethanolamine N-methyltransferase
MCHHSHIDSKIQNTLHRLIVPAILLAVVAGVSLHLYARHVSWWWLPSVVVLVLAHGLILGGAAWFFARHRGHRHGATGGEQSHALHAPHSYDRLVRILTLGQERRFRQRTLDLAEVKTGERVLDVGCGTGTLLIEAAKRVGATGAAHGIEISPEMIAQARRKAEEQLVAVNLHEGSADRLPYPDASFDVVLCTMTLHHLPAPMQAAAIAEMRRVLRPGGRVVLVDFQSPPTVKAALSPVGLFHRLMSGHAGPDWPSLLARLNQQGLQLVNQHALLGGAVGMVVGCAKTAP